MNDKEIEEALENYLLETDGDSCDPISKLAKEKAFIAGIDCEKTHSLEVLKKLNNFSDLFEYVKGDNPDMSVIIRAAYNIGYDKATEDFKSTINILL